MRSKPIAGRHLGWSNADLASKPYARFWNTQPAPLPAHVRHALHRGPVADSLLPPVSAAPEILFGTAPVLEDGFPLTADGAMHVAARTDLPGVTPAMIDWWFGWHSNSPERYKLWHPQAHVHAAWLSPPPAGTRGRARYVGYSSIVDEYIGSNLIRAAIRFVNPETLGFTRRATGRKTACGPPVAPRIYGGRFWAMRRKPLRRATAALDMTAERGSATDLGDEKFYVDRSVGAALAAFEKSQHQVGEASERRLQETRSVKTALQEYTFAMREGLEAKLAMIGADPRCADAPNGRFSATK
jgi:hypothetical protein